jgi:hypothetical protein
VSVQLLVHPVLERFHHRLTVGLVMEEPLRGIELPFLGLSVDAVDLAQGFEHVAAFAGEAGGDRDELTPSMR